MYCVTALALCGVFYLDTGKPWTPQNESKFLCINPNAQQSASFESSTQTNKQKPLVITTPFLPLPCTVSLPLAKPGKLLPLVSLSQEKKSGTSIQMITELGKPSLCPLLPFVPSLRRSAPHQLVLICLAAVKAPAAPMASL